MSKKISLEYSDSESDTSSSYEDTLISNLKVCVSNTDSSKKSHSESSSNKPTDSRIEFVKNILDGNKLKPMIDFNNCDTETSSNANLNKRTLNVIELFKSMDVKLRYIKSGTTGHTFKAISTKDPNIEFAVKVCAYPKDDYGAMTNLSRPENAELRMLKLLSYFVIKRSTPHFVLPIGTFNTSITNFTNLPKNFIDINDKKNIMYKKFINKYKKGKFEEMVSVLISEWANGGDLLDFIRKTYQEITLRKWIVIIFQILFTLSLIHRKYPAFRHNDMKANNILVQLTETEDSDKILKNQSMPYYCYNMDDVRFVIPNIGIQIKIWDFDFACIDGVVENNKVNSKWTNEMHITKKENKYYDMHYFFNTLISERFFPQFYKGGAPPEIIEFVHRIIPEKYRNGGKYVNEKGRIQVDSEYTTPYKVIMNDPLFSKYRYIGQKNSKK